MKLFLDSSENFLIISIINSDNKVIDFKKIKSNNDIAKNSIKNIDDFLNKNKIKIDNINEVYFTIGPGKFTGVKIPYNILASLNLTNNFKNIYVINSLKLLEKNSKLPAIKFTSKKFYVLKKYLFFLKKILIKTENELEEINISTFDKFSANDLELKIKKKKFKLVNNFNNIKLIYK